MKDNKAIIALYNIQKKLYEDGDFFTKQGKNLHFKSKYLQLPDLLSKVVPLLHNEGCMLLQGSRHSDNPDIAIIQTKIIHLESGDEYLNETDLPVAKLSPQEMGKAVTYGRRYGLEPLFGIPTKDDDGEGAMKRVEKKKVADSMEPMDPFPHIIKALKKYKINLTKEEIKEILKPMGLKTDAEILTAGSPKVLSIIKAKVGGE